MSYHINLTDQEKIRAIEDLLGRYNHNIAENYGHYTFLAEFNISYSIFKAIQFPLLI